MTEKCELVQLWDEAVMYYLRLLSRYLHRDTEENDEDIQSPSIHSNWKPLNIQ